VTHYDEDIAIGAAVTYTSGGIPVTVAKGVQITLVDSVTAKALSSAGLSGTLPLLAAVQGSESGQAFKIRAYQQSGTSGLFAELGGGSTELQNQPLHVAYEGT
jgi:hypothetical protein